MKTDWLRASWRLPVWVVFLILFGTALSGCAPMRAALPLPTGVPKIVCSANMLATPPAKPELPRAMASVVAKQEVERLDAHAKLNTEFRADVHAACLKALGAP